MSVYLELIFLLLTFGYIQLAWFLWLIHYSLFVTAKLCFLFFQLYFRQIQHDYCLMILGIICLSILYIFSKVLTDIVFFLVDCIYGHSLLQEYYFVFGGSLNSCDLCVLIYFPYCCDDFYNVQYILLVSVFVLGDIL